jgi:hypothetical protein
MVHINEELKAAKAAKAAINALSMATPQSAVLATLGEANHAAILNLSSGGALNEARGGPGCLNRFSASISGASAGVRLPSGVAAG